MSFAHPELGPWPALGYVGNPLDRAAHLRPEGVGLARAPQARAYLLGGELVALKGDADAADPLFAPAEAEAWTREAPVFLGLAGGTPRAAFPFDPARREEMEAAGLLVADLRSIAVRGLVGPEHLGPIACGKALLGWHRRHGFCANCGAATTIIEAGWRRDCPSCGAQHFPRTDPVVIMLTAHGDACLLGRQPQFAPGMYSCLAGFVEPGESLEEAVRRETLEEAGIATGKVAYHACQPWPFPMSLMIGCLAEATSQDITIDPAEIEAARWFGRGEVAQMLARTHPDGLFAPPPVSIAHHLMRAFLEGARA
ncbi:NAD(+) diphosphatase [Xanthobacter sp. KR7-225]|uniref:NAD(+) diphosphatase n=1 Tax=Xanthobacter sp. KR7-225 TaxID=3156613 RepID=UPI0032B51535